jgi:hypothetical protein
MRPAGIARLLPALVLLATTCSGDGSTSGEGPDTTTAAPTTSASPTASQAAAVPAEVPAGFDEDVPASKVPPEALVPPEADATGVWLTETREGEAIVVAWVVPAGDPFRRPGGFAEWRRFAGAAPPWRPVVGDAHTQEDGVLGTRAVTADVTGDGSADAIVTEETGGSGACARRSVLDLAAGDVVWRRSLCDADVTPSADPVGLSVVEAVFRPNDAHCCPSRIRTTVLAYDGDGRWRRSSVHVAKTRGEK